ncbi:hypothetical protein M1512_01850 [Patescibacteria group bacterium]|nr:hypothetical protein [Patescibacteria group bacterium]
MNNGQDEPNVFNQETPATGTQVRSEQPDERKDIDLPGNIDMSISWTASEFIAHDKGISWYIYLFIGAILLTGIVYVLTKDVMTASTIIIAAIALAIFAAKKPREQQYKIDRHGLSVGDHLYPFEKFRSFAVIRQGEFSNLQFMPMRRFALGATAYFNPADETKIVDLLSSYLPMEDKHQDPLDGLMWRIRF